jgi:hypothetical protein
LINKIEFCFKTIIASINSSIVGQNNKLKYDENSKNKKLFSILIFYLYHLAALKNIRVDLNADEVDSTGKFLNINADQVFAQVPFALDARQFITVNRFTKYREKNDKACFLFHGVGTGKTFTSLSIAISHLSDINKFTRTIEPEEDDAQAPAQAPQAPDNSGKKEFEILVMCPQGLFLSAFGDDAVKLGMYVYDITTYQVLSDKVNYVFEKFYACIKVSDTEYYKILVTGFDYLNLFKEKGISQITQQYDVLICDEAHKLITEKLKPLSKETYKIGYKGRGKTVDGDTYFEQAPDDVSAIKDKRFFEFVKDKILSQSIFLTGTPIQKSPDDLISLVKFLNLKEINQSNNKSLCEQIIANTAQNPDFYFKGFDRSFKPLDDDLIKGAASLAYLTLENLSDSKIYDLETKLKGTPKFSTSDKILAYCGIKMSAAELSQTANDLIVHVQTINHIITYYSDPLHQAFLIATIKAEIVQELAEPLALAIIDKIKEELQITDQDVQTMVALGKSIAQILTPENIAKIKNWLDAIPQNNAAVINQAIVQPANNVLQQQVTRRSARVAHRAAIQQAAVNATINPGGGGGGGRGGANTELTKYASEIPEQGLALKQEIDALMTNYNEDSVVDTDLILEAIAKDTGLSEDSIQLTISHLYDCINGNIPYEESKTILSNENVKQILEPLLGANYNFLENPISQQIMKGGKKNKQSRKRKLSKSNKKTLRNKRKYSGGQSELVEKNIQNDILVKEIPILLNLYLHNFNLTIETQFEYFSEQVLSNVNSNEDLSDYAEDLNYLETLISYFGLKTTITAKNSAGKVEELNDEEELNEEEKIGGDPPGKGKKLYAFIRTLLQDISSLATGGGGGSLNINDIINAVIPKIINAVIGIAPTAMYVGTDAKSLALGSLAGNLSPYAISLIIFITKVLMNVLMYLISLALKEYNLDNIIKNIMPFISIYNYDYINSSIDNKKFYTDISTTNFQIEKYVNSLGTTNAFPAKFIENIYYPYTVNQLKDLKESFKDFILKKAFSLGIIQLSSERNANLTYDINNKLNDISCDMITSVFNKDKDYTDADLVAPYDGLAAIYDTYSNSNTITSRKGKYQLGKGIYINLKTENDKVTAKQQGVYENLRNVQKIPLNISGSYIDIKSNISTSNSYLSNLISKLKLPANAIAPKFLQKEPYKKAPYNADNTKFQNALELLKIIRSGVVYHDKKFVLHPHYILYNQAIPDQQGGAKGFMNNLSKFLGNPYDKDDDSDDDEDEVPPPRVPPPRVPAAMNNLSKFLGNPYDEDDVDGPAADTAAAPAADTAADTAADAQDANQRIVEYFLPVVYPPTENIMFGFCQFLNDNSYKYIWMNKYFDPINLKKQFKLGSEITFPIKGFEEGPDENPICIIVSPNHKEGFSFIYNPVLISLGLSETAGDEEQIYGRVLRKYAKDAFDGKYDKKIYQYFSGGNKDTVTLPLLTSLYALEAKTMFRGMYDSSGYTKTTAFWNFRTGVIGWQLVDSITLSIFQGYDGLQVNNWIVTDRSKKFLAKEELPQSQHRFVDSDVEYNDQMKPEEREGIMEGMEAKEQFMDDNFSVFDVADELQLKLLYSVKFISLEFFKKIAEKENSQLNKGFGTYIWSMVSRTELTPKGKISPIDVMSMLDTRVEPKTYCIENLAFPGQTEQLYINVKGNDMLNIKTALVCTNKGIPTIPGGGYNKKHKITRKKKFYNKNKKTRYQKK